MMNVKAAAGLKVPMENKPNTYITEQEAVAVEESAYYLRRIEDGDLLIEDAPAPAKKESK